VNQPSTEQTEQIQTAHTLTTVHRQSGCRLKLEMKVSPEATLAAYLKAIKNVSREISLPGFRKGKAPEALILKQYGKHVTREWHDTVANTAFQEFLQETKFYPFTRDRSVKRVEVKSASQKEGAEVIIEYEASPNVPEVDKSKIKILPFPRRTISSQDVDERIHALQLHHADWSLVTDRPLQEGDFVDLDIVAIDTHPPRPICAEMRFEVAPGKMGSWMRQLVIGKSAGDTVEGLSEREENEKSEGEFQPTQCRITIRAIYTTQLPELNSAFAEKLGVKELSELPPRVEEDLNRRADAEVQDRHRAQVEEQLLSLYNFDLPSSMISDQKRHMVAERLHHLQRSGTMTRPLDEVRKEIEAGVTEELNRSYRLFFLCRGVADAQKIEVFQNEIMDEMGRQMMLSPEQAQSFSNMGAEEMQSKLYVNVLSRKALDFLAS
jgi:trigger factor